MYGQVIVDIVHENVAHVFTYRVPEDMALMPGTRVLVPFRSQKMEGVVLSLSETSEIPESRLKTILRALEPYPAILPALIELAEEMAQSAHCPLAQTLRLMMPAALRGGRVQEKKEWTARLMLDGVTFEEACAAQGRSAKRRMLLSLMRDGAPHPASELKLMVREPMEALRQLEAQGLAVLSQEAVFRSPYQELGTEKLEDPPLMPAQREALEEMDDAIAGGTGRFLLHGVTGSGKTEVFIRLVRKVLEKGRGAIILVPEIALTPQMVAWFRARFGETAAVLHSRLTNGERFDEWRKIRLGVARVAIGARSAVFAPVENLGLIVVDEEHEQTYLSDRHPRYDAREVAKSRCKRERATLLLSSATPSVLSFAMARRGDYTLLEMPVRVMDRPMPHVEVVDMRMELESGNRSMFSGLLFQKLRDCIGAGRQAMLFLNRRGYSSFVSCRRCGYVVKCGQCDIAMTYHLNGSDGRLHCHYCGGIAQPPEKCPQCGSAYIRYFGAGTQKVEEEVKKLFPGVGVLRMDVDTTRSRDAHHTILSQFRAGEAQVLIGTQMIAKGLDFPHVTLVGVVAADMTLNLPDYRARERTFQLLTQVAGRAGRAGEPGEVVIQTYKPDESCIQAAAAQDYRAFFENEFPRRRAGLYPPFTMMARLLAESPDGGQAQRTARELYQECQAFLEGHPHLRKRVLMMRLDEAPVKMIRGKNRYHVLMKLFEHPDTEGLTGFFAGLSQREWPGCDVYFEMNPASMM